MIEWTPVDVLTCLETEPAVDEEATSYRYTISRQGLVLALEIWPYASDVWVAIRQVDREDPILDLGREGCRDPLCPRGWSRRVTLCQFRSAVTVSLELSRGLAVAELHRTSRSSSATRRRDNRA